MKEDDPEPKAPLPKKQEKGQEINLPLKKYKAERYRKVLNILKAGFLAHLRQKGLLPKTKTLH